MDFALIYSKWRPEMNNNVIYVDFKTGKVRDSQKGQSILTHLLNQPKDKTMDEIASLFGREIFKYEPPKKAKKKKTVGSKKRA